MNNPICKNCKFAVLEDNGYSNYTVMGTDFHCAKNAHPEKTFDIFYWEAPEFKKHTSCSEFSAGSPIEIDVERDVLVYFSPEEKEIYNMVFPTEN